MRKILLIALSLLLAIALFACDGDNSESSTSDVGSQAYSDSQRTQAFYAAIDKNSYYVDITITEGDKTYNLKQATNGKTVTTIKSGSEASDNEYSIFDGSATHYLDFENKRYDTFLSTKGQNFIYADYNPASFASPSSSGEAQFSGVSCYYEAFETIAAVGESITGEDKYYFDGSKLVGVEIAEGGTIKMTMKINSYSNVIPSDVLMEAPADFAKGHIDIDVTVDTSGWWD